MKKVFCLLLVLCLMISAVPVFADSISEEVLLEVKAKIDIPEELTEFSYSENKYDEVLRYDFNWHDEDYTKEIYVSTDSQGKIVNYSFYENLPYDSSRVLIDYTIEDAKVLSDAFVQRVYEEYQSGDDVLKRDEALDISSYSGRYKTFTFTYQRYYKGENVNSNRVVVRVRATKDKIYVYSVSAALDSNGKFSEDNAKVLNEDDYLSVFPIKLFYAPEYTENGREIKLFYNMDKGYVSRTTGEEVKEKFFERYAFTEDSVAMESMGTSNGANKNNAMLTEEEIGELEKMNSLIKPEEITQKLKGFEILKITDDMKMNNTYTYKSEEKYFVRFELLSEEREMSITYNGETGLVTSIYSYKTKYDSSEETGYNKNAPEEEIKAFAAEISEKRTDETETTFRESGTTGVVMISERIVNGVSYPSNNITVMYDLEEERVTSYYLSWDEDVSDFPDPSMVVGVEKAKERIFNIAPLYNAYVNTENGYVPSVTVSRSVLIDAVTGKDSYESEEEKMEYTDIDSHWAEKEIRVLFEHDIYLPGDKFNPDSNITQADMLRLFSACRSSGVIPITWLKERVSEYAVESGYIEIAEPDKEMTREEAFDALVKIIGYGEVAEFDIYKSSYTDATDFEKIGSGEILKAMGILTGDTARPKDYITSAEAAVMVYRYLAR